MSDLKRKKQELDKEVRRISKELKRLGRQRRSGGKLQICTGQRNAAQALMVMRDGEPTAAMAFLKSKCKCVNPDATGWVELETDLRAWWISADDDTKKKHTQIHDTNRELHSAIEQARRFIVDEELEIWVADQNVSKGINPVPAITLREASLVKRRIGVDETKTHRGARQWMQRWRRRRGLRLRKFAASEPMEKKDLHGKASAQMDATNVYLPLSYFNHPVSPWDHKKRPFFGTGFEAAHTAPSTRRCQKTIVFVQRVCFCVASSAAWRGESTVALEQLSAEHGSTRARTSSH